LSVLYKFQKDRIKDSIIKRVKVEKFRKYRIFPISRQVRKCEKFNSIPKRLMTVGSQEGSVFTARLLRLQDKHFTIISAIKTPPGSIRHLQMK